VAQPTRPRSNDRRLALHWLTTRENRAALPQLDRGQAGKTSAHRHFGPHPDTLLLFIVTSGPRFTK
jgi:hypothetical protein